MMFAAVKGAPGSTDTVAHENNIPAGKHFTDCAAPGSILFMHQPPGQAAAVLGDIVATRLKLRGVLGAVTNGRVRDIVSCDDLCADGKFTLWSHALSTVGTSMESKPCAVDIPVTVGNVEIRPGDVLVADEGERGCVVIPQDKLSRCVELLETQKKADDGLLEDVKQGMSMAEAIKRHPDHYSVQPH
jgi:regulator of RNase E activity RraA